MSAEKALGRTCSFPSEQPRNDLDSLVRSGLSQDGANMNLIDVANVNVVFGVEPFGRCRVIRQLPANDHRDEKVLSTMSFKGGYRRNLALTQYS